MENILMFTEQGSTAYNSAGGTLRTLKKIFLCKWKRSNSMKELLPVP